jgi:hypothetical protein
MRNIQIVITGVLTALPDPSTLSQPLRNNMLTLVAELEILQRWGMYAPPESSTELWEKLGSTLYRYMPLPTFAPWAQAVSDLVTAK